MVTPNMNRFAIYDDDDNQVGLYTGAVKKDGYEWGDRLLEDVWFHADMVDGIVDLNSIKVAPDAAEYFSQLNEEKWLEKAEVVFAQEDEHFVRVDNDEEIWNAS